MRRAILASVALLLVLSGCGRLAESRVNPFNWFGGDREERVASAAATDVVPLRDDVLMPRITRLEAAPHPGGAIVSARALAPSEGYYDAELVEVANDGRTLVLEFRAKPPANPQRTGTSVTRELLGGLFLSTQSLAGARTITVVGSENRRSVSRR